MDVAPDVDADADVVAPDEDVVDDSPPLRRDENCSSFLLDRRSYASHYYRNLGCC